MIWWMQWQLLLMCIHFIARKFMRYRSRSFYRLTTITSKICLSKQSGAIRRKRMYILRRFFPSKSAKSLAFRFCFGLARVQSSGQPLWDHFKYLLNCSNTAMSYYNISLTWKLHCWTFKKRLPRCVRYCYLTYGDVCCCFLAAQQRQMRKLVAA